MTQEASEQKLYLVNHVAFLGGFGAHGLVLLAGEEQSAVVGVAGGRCRQPHPVRGLDDLSDHGGGRGAVLGGVNAPSLQ